MTIQTPMLAPYRRDEFKEPLEYDEFVKELDAMPQHFGRVEGIWLHVVGMQMMAAIRAKPTLEVCWAGVLGAVVWGSFSGAVTFF